MKLSHLLPTLAATITNHDRYLVRPGRDFEWSNELWTHNLFRAFEVVFGAYLDIRPSIASWHDESGIEHQAAYSFEGQIALFETWVRSLHKHFAFKLVVVPQLQLAGMARNGLIPYRFAIAHDADSGIGGNTATLAHTITGSNTLLHVGQIGDINSTNTITGITYNSVAMTLVDSIRYPSDRWTQNAILVAPSTGANNIVSSGSTFNQLGGISYTGCKQSGQPDSHTSVNGTSSSTFTATTSVVAANCWLSCFAYGDPNTAGAGTTLRGTKNGGAVMADSNATVSTGSQSLVINYSSAQNQIGEIVSIAPLTAATVIHSLASLGAGS